MLMRTCIVVMKERCGEPYGRTGVGFFVLEMSLESNLPGFQLRLSANEAMSGYTGVPSSSPLCS